MATSVALCLSDSAEASALGFLALLALGAAPFPPFRLETIETGHSVVLSCTQFTNRFHFALTNLELVRGNDGSAVAGGFVGFELSGDLLVKCATALPCVSPTRFRLD